MTSERWQKIKALLDRALELDEAARRALLDRECADDAEIRSEVESLIASYEEDKSFLESPAFEGAAAAISNDGIASLSGRMVGPYKLIREIGHGGMGTVCLAVRADDEYKKRVAIKLVRRGMDTEQILSRFRHERQILASLDHPNIARLLDGGTTSDGLPYFVMDYIEGQPIDEYCDAHRLTTQERLNLFRAVCSAVHYAHQNLVVHRDLKPGNILVTPDGTPKLLDFGIAKLLKPEMYAQTIAPTVTTVRPMTPDYASPEQVRGQPITTASDIYSLGVLLYELLTGHRPYRIRSSRAEDMERAICEQEPEKPSAAVSRAAEARTNSSRASSTASPTRDGGPEKLKKKLVGDLDNIVLMAMRKEPQRRYASADELSEDLRRHLEGLPCLARRDTFSYRAGKFIRRHRVGVAAAALLIVTMIAGIVAVAWQARVASRQRALAERRFNDVRELANSFMFDIHDEIAKLPGSTPARQILVERALRYLDRLAEDSANDHSLQQELATAYDKLGDVQGESGFANLGDTAGALESYLKAKSLREALYQANPDDAGIRRELAEAVIAIGNMQNLTGDNAAALESFRRALPLFESLAAEDPKDVKAALNVSLCMNKIADRLAFGGDPASALENYRKVLDLNEELYAADPDNAQVRRALWYSLIKNGDTLGNPTAPNVGDRGGAIETYRRALALYEPVASDPTNAKARRDLLINYNRLGATLEGAGKLAEALSCYRKGGAITKELADADPKNAEAQRDLSISYEAMTHILYKLGDLKGALENCRQMLAIREKLSAADPASSQARRDVFLGLMALGGLMRDAGKLDEAIETFRKATAIIESLVSRDQSNLYLRRDQAEMYSEMGKTHKVVAEKSNRTGAWREARAWFERSLDILSDLRNQNALSGTDALMIDSATAEIARCDAALPFSKK